ncbi:oligosaccharide flippase family protein [Desulfogranum mediterraneum]|uniref:oligosaccharide flippase family protein n=1 Tax=Desulfogranum mediterraneum TaxID=160661 RepID=UPI000683FBC1|nr:oligosaccharide flippase family protein [Desulfogranum mediterraneum]
MTILQRCATLWTEKNSFKTRVLRGSTWTVAGHAVNQFLRLGSNLILTRLLFPEAFGLMSLTQVFMTGLAMFSDIGIVPSIIQHPRGKETAFLNTAWTLQIIRGFFIWGVAMLLAGTIAAFYGEPLLEPLLYVVGFNAVIQGFNSTKLATANRKLVLGRLTLLELGSYIIGLIVMISSAWVTRSVWALVYGGLVGSFAKMLFSHLFLDGEANRCRWEREAFQALLKYGRWIFIGTALTFLAGQGERLLMGRLLDVNFLAFYTLAFTLNQLLPTTFQQIAGKVLFPSYAKLYREGNEKFYQFLKNVRLLNIGLSWIISLIFIWGGVELIGFLYDPRYASAGWILQIIAFGALVGCLSGSYSGVLMGLGKFRQSSLLLALQIIVKFTLMYAGYLFWGEKGLVIGTALTGLFIYPATAIYFSRLSLWQPEIDVPFIALAITMLSYFLIQ